MIRSVVVVAPAFLTQLSDVHYNSQITDQITTLIVLFGNTGAYPNHAPIMP